MPTWDDFDRQTAKYRALSPFSQRMAMLLFKSGLPFLLAWAYIATLRREIKNAFWYARNEVRINMEAYRETMRRLRPR